MAVTVYDAALCLEEARLALAATHDRIVDVLAALSEEVQGGCLHLTRRDLSTMGSEGPARFMCVGPNGCGAIVDADGNLVDG